MSETVLIMLVALLLMCSAFFSGSEIAFATANKPRIRSLADQGDKRAVKAQGIVDDFVRAISTILVGNDLVNIAATSLVTVLCAEHLFRGDPQAGSYAELIATMLLLVFGEICPKILAADHADRLVLSFSGPLRGAMKIFNPIVWLVSGMVRRLEPLWTPVEDEASQAAEELALVVDTIQEEGVFTESEGELIKSAIEVRELMAKDILIPRVDVIAYDLDEPLDTLLDSEEAMSCSRIPVYRESIDHIIGILPTKQLMKAVLTAPEGTAPDVEAMLVEPTFVHMTKNVLDILKDFRENQRNMAVVLDEYGGTMGILTTEDILEEIVGDIYDETDEAEEETVEVVSQDTFLLDGDMTVDDAFDSVAYRPKEFESEYTTLSGWVTEQLDRFPEPGDSFTYERLCVTVKEVENYVASQVEIHLLPEEETDKGLF